jgi:transposase
LVPEDHILRRVDKVLDLSWLADEVRDLYCADNGRPSIDPEAAVRLMLAGFFQGIVRDRELLREAQVNLAIRWFAGYRLDEKLPDHSSLTRIRQRWGAQKFRQIFRRGVESCIRAGLVNAETVHVDATLIRADVSWDSVVVMHADRVVEENGESATTDDPNPLSGTGNPKKHSMTDPEATLATGRRGRPLEPSYKQHTAVEERSGVIVDVAVTTGEASEGTQLLAQIERIETNTGKRVKTVTADTGYAHSANYAGLEARGIEAVIPPQRVHGRPARIPLHRFKYDERNGIVRCPAGCMLRPGKRNGNKVTYRSTIRTCAACGLRKNCVPPSAKVRLVALTDGYPALLRARRRHARADERWRMLAKKHHWRIEGIHGQAKTQHGLGRAARRGLDNVAIQVYMTAIAMNLKRLAKALEVFAALMGRICRLRLPERGCVADAHISILRGIYPRITAT